MGELSRREFLKIAAGSSAAITGDFGSKTVEKLIPYVIQPERIKPAEWSIFATTCRECPAGCGLHVRHTNGRVVKVEGNPNHPINQGGLCPRGQSSVQGLYDPDRVQRILCGKCNSEMDEWEFDALAQELAAANGKIVMISDLQTGSLAGVMDSFLSAFGAKGKLYFYEPFNYEPLRAANRQLFGIDAIPSYDLEKCDFIISFGADFLESWISNVEYSWQFSKMHSINGAKTGGFVYVGPRYSMTAVNANDFIKVPAGQEHLIAIAMLNAIIENGWAKNDVSQFKPQISDITKFKISGIDDKKITDLARRFAQSNQSVALAGPVGAGGKNATELAAAAMLLNYACGRIGQTVDFSRTHAFSRTSTTEQMRGVLSNLSSDDILIIHNSNLVYSIPEAAQHIRRAKRVIYMGTMHDETSKFAKWILPIDSPLESWGDYEPQSGIHGLMQPTMARLFDITRPSGDILITIAKSAGKPISRNGSTVPISSFEDWLKLRWQELHAQIAPQISFEEFWISSLRSGGAWQKSAPSKVITQVGNFEFSAPTPNTEKANELWLWASVSLFDGRVSNRGWLQELPDSNSGIVWGNWADIHPSKAQSLALCDGDIIEVSNQSAKIELPVRITEDVAENTIAIAFGQGHTTLGRNAAHIGANAFELLGNSDSDSVFGNANIRITNHKQMPVYAYATQDQHHREIIQWTSESEMQSGKKTLQKFTLPLPENYSPDKDLYSPPKYKEHRWAMVIDLSRCIGCGTCAVACYAENNVGIVGKEQVDKGRWMAWLKIVPYRKQDDPSKLGFLPLLCQHCDAAPCEPVCPVFASVHDDEGLNSQVYNRCIGTRYCSHNCPYKVRRFNWFDYKFPTPLDLQLNPEVSVRCRGVMEKCTFCIQRIRAAEITAKREKRKVRDGEIQPACMQSCPTKVFAFGDLLDPDSQVSKLTRNDPRRYHVLEELNTKPAVTYLRRIVNDERV